MSNNNESSTAAKRWYLVLTIVVLLINILLVVANIILLSMNAPAKNIGFDYCGVIVAIFGVLVTLLVAWNIYSVVDSKSKLEKIDKYQEDLEIVQQKVNEMNTYVRRLKYKVFKQSKIVDKFSFETDPKTGGEDSVDGTQTT